MNWQATPSPPPVPVRVQRKRGQSGMRATMAVAAAMVGWLVLLALISAATTDVNQLLPGVPIEVGAGVFIRPSAGWRAAAQGDEAAAWEFALQKGGTRLSIEVGEYAGSSTELLEFRMALIGEEVEVLRSMLLQPLVMGGDGGGSSAAFTAISGNVQLDGRVAVLVRGGLGIVATEVATAGELEQTMAEVEQMLAGMEIP